MNRRSLYALALALVLITLAGCTAAPSRARPADETKQLAAMKRLYDADAESRYYIGDFATLEKTPMGSAAGNEFRVIRFTYQGSVAYGIWLTDAKGETKWGLVSSEVDPYYFADAYAAGGTPAPMPKADQALFWRHAQVNGTENLDVSEKGVAQQVVYRNVERWHANTRDWLQWVYDPATDKVLYLYSELGAYYGSGCANRLLRPVVPLDTACRQDAVQAGCTTTEKLLLVVMSNMPPSTST